MAYDASDSKMLHKCIHHIEAQLVGTRTVTGVPDLRPLTRIAKILSSEVRTICQVLIRVAFGSYVPQFCV